MPHPSQACLLLSVALALAAGGCGLAEEEPYRPRGDAGRDAAPGDAAPDAPRDAAAEAEAGLPPFSGDPWALTDLWMPVPDDHGLGLHQARLWDRPDPFTPRPWTSCGVGCEAAPADPPGIPTRPPELWPGADAVAPTSLVNGELHARLRVGTRVVGATGNETFVASVRLGDARTVAMIRTNYLVAGAERSSAAIFPAMDEVAGPGFTRTLRITVASDGLAHDAGVWWPWLPSPAGVVGYTYDWDGGWGYSANGRIMAAGGPTETTFRTLTAESVDVFDVMGQGDQLLGAGSVTTLNDTLYSYSQATGMVALYTAPADHYVWGSALGERYIAWILATPYLDAHTFSRAWICWAPRVKRREEMVVIQGPELTGTWLVSNQLHVGLDHAAAFDGNNGKYYVWNLSTGRQWVIRAASDGSGRRLMGVDATYVYLKEWEPNAPTPQLFQRLVRWRLDQLDALEAASQTW